MAINLTCVCGTPVAVELSQAGSELACRCGQPIRVPSLSKLRELSGKGAYEAGIIDTICRMVGNAELPFGEMCALCGEPTNDVIDLYVHAEQVSEIGTSAGAAALVAILFSPLIAIAMAIKPQREIGRDTFVPAPLRMCAKHEGRVRKASQRTLKGWLKSVPVYARLLREYPKPRVVFEVPGDLGTFEGSSRVKFQESQDLDFEN
jgi:hypothetical protein